MKAKVTPTFSNEVLRRVVVFATIKNGIPPTSREIAEVLGWTPSRLSMTRQGLCRLTANDMLTLAKWCGASVEDLATPQDFAKAATTAAMKINY